MKEKPKEREKEKMSEKWRRNKKIIKNKVELIVKIHVSMYHKGASKFLSDSLKSRFTPPQFTEASSTFYSYSRYTNICGIMDT